MDWQYSSMLERIAIEQQRPSVEWDEAMAAIGRILDEVKEERCQVIAEA